MCWSYNRQYGTRYLAAMPTNLYGTDNFDLITSHVLPALLRKAHTAMAQGEHTLTVSGDGNAAARVSAFRRCGRGVRVSAGA